MSIIKSFDTTRGVAKKNRSNIEGFIHSKEVLHRNPIMSTLRSPAMLLSFHIIAHSSIIICPCCVMPLNKVLKLNTQHFLNTILSLFRLVKMLIFVRSFGTMCGCKLIIMRIENWDKLFFIILKMK